MKYQLATIDRVVQTHKSGSLKTIIIKNVHIEA